MTISEKLPYLEIPNYDTSISRVDLLRVEKFVDEMTDRLFNNHSAIQIQHTIRTDSNIEIVTYITHIVEIGISKALVDNKLFEFPKKEIENFSQLIAWAINLALGNQLVDRGMVDIPTLDGPFYIYFSGPTLELLIDRASLHISKAKQLNILGVESYMNYLIDTNL